VRRSAVNLSPLRQVSGPVTVGTMIDFIEKRCILPESREPMVLHQYQQDLIEQWCDPSSKAHLTVIGAGNAKTTTLGAYLVAHLFLEPESNVPVVAETVTQAVLTAWGRVKRFVELNPDLDERAEVLEGQGSRRGVYVPGMGGHCYPIADKPAGLQGLIPSRAVLEETSEATMATFGALLNRMGKRPDSKLIGISTPSFTPDNALLTVQQKAGLGDPLPGVVLNEHISPQTDHRDEGQWHLANPALAPGVLDISAIRTDLAVLPEQSFRAYRLCQNPKGSAACWLNSVDESGDETGDAFEVWSRTERPTQLREGASTWVGIDVSKSRDTTAVVWGQYVDEGRFHVLCRIWTPTRDSVIDLEDVADHLRMLNGKFDVKAMFADPSYFYNLEALAREGLPMIAVGQTPQRMAPYVAQTYEAIRKGQITHNADEQFAQQVLAARRHYSSGSVGWTISKKVYSHKIDSAIALILAFGASTTLAEPEPDYSDPRSWKVY
jgi:phage terminase large subunit-like protein